MRGQRVFDLLPCGKLRGESGILANWSSMMSRCVAIALCVSFLTVAFFAAPAIRTAEAAVAADPVTMYVGYVQTPDTLNIFAMTLSISYTINFLVYDTLNSVEPDLSPGPQLAQSWEHNTDGTVWTFHLVEDATWHDGQAVTAEDVEFSLELVMDNDEECALWGGYVEDFTDVSCPDGPDGYTVQITTSVPKATMLSIMVPILPQHIWSLIPVEELTTHDPFDDEYFPTGPIGSGPLMLESYDAVRGVVTFSKFDDYYIDTVKVDKVIFQIFKTDDAMTTALYAGDIDVAAGVPAKAWDKTLDTESVDGQKVKSMSIFELGINCAPEWMRSSDDFPSASDNLETTNLSVRHAIAYAVDKSQIVDEILRGLAEEGSTLIPPATSFWHYNVTEDEEFEFDLDKANDTLDAAGYIDVDDDGIRENSTNEDAELSFTLYYRQEKVDDQLAAGKIKGWLDSIGMEITTIGVTEMNLYTIWYQCKYDLYIWAWDFDVDPSFALSVLTTDEIPEDQNDYTAWSDAFYTNPEYDELFVEQQNTPDNAERQTIINEMQQILYHDCPYIVLWYPFGLYAYRTDRFYNFPDMESQPGITPGTMWFYFDVSPIGTNAPPTDADAGDDVTIYVGETLSFTGNASDATDPVTTLEWTWTFEEPTSEVVTLDGITVSYTFVNEGNVTVTLTATDPGGLNDTDTLVVTVVAARDDVGWAMGYVKDLDEAPIAGATVLVGESSRKTDTDGMYNVTDVPGTYDVSVTAPGFTGSEGDVTLEVGVVSWLNFTLEPTTGTLTGHVYDNATGDPIAYASVVVMLPTENKSVMTSTDGMFEFLYLPAGEFTLKVSADGYDSNETVVTVVAGESLDIEMNLIETVEATSDDDGGGISTAVLAVIGIVTALAVAGATLILIKRKKKGEVPPPPTP